MTIQIACDGSCIQQGDFRKGDDTDRPGAAGFVAKVGDRMVGKAVPHANGTIGAMEVMALRMGLEFALEIGTRRPGLRSDEPIRIVCDSQYAVNGYNEWLRGWAAKGYSKKGGLANALDWRVIDGLKSELGSAVEVVWTKGHSNHALNNAVDQLVNTAARTQRGSDDTHLVLGLPGVSQEDAARLYDYSRTVGFEPGPRMLDPVTTHSPSDFLGTDVLAPDQPETAPETAPVSGIRAQALAMLARAGDDPRLSALLADGLEMALDERRLTARHDQGTLDAAHALKTVLEQRGQGR